MRKNARKPRRTLIFLTCLLAVPTVYGIMYGVPTKITLPVLAPLLLTGTVLGLAHLLLRPLLRLITAPLGCMTLGLSGTAIDILLIYLSDYLVDDFRVPGFLYALLTALLINAVSSFVGARR